MSPAPYDSNSEPFIVLNAEVQSQGGIHVYIYSPSNPSVPLEILHARTEPTAMEQLNDDGAGSFKINVHDPKIDPTQGGDPTLLNYGNLFRVFVNGKCVQCCEITGKNIVVVGTGEKAEEAWAITGKGYGATVMKNAVVYPELGLKKMSMDTRYFSFASKQGDWYVPSAWTTPVKVAQVNNTNPAQNPWAMTNPPASIGPFAFPFGNGTTNNGDWPIGAANAWWVWDRSQTPGSGNFPPFGDIYIRQTFTTTDPLTDVTVYFAAEDFAWAYIDGQQIAAQTSRIGYQKTTYATITIPAGTHTFGIRAKVLYNGAAATSVGTVYGGAGVVYAVSAQATALPGQTIPNTPYWILMSGDGNQSMQAYPNPAPGWGVGEIIKDLVQEALARNVQGMANITLNFTDFLDSSGAAWATVLNWQFGVGTKYRDILTQFSQNACDWSFDPLSLQLSLWNQRGVDRTLQSPQQDPVYLRPAQNVTAAEIDGTAEISNWLLIKSQEGWNEVNGASASLTNYGRRENFLSTSSEVDSTAQAQAQAQLFSSQQPQEQVTISFVSGPNLPVPWIDFGVGDFIFGPDVNGQPVRRRVMSISVQEDEAGNPVYTVEFDTVLQTAEVRIQRWLQSIGGGTLDGSAAASLVYGQTNPPLTTDGNGAGSGNPASINLNPAGYLSSLQDVSVAGRTVGQALTWNGTKWVPITPPSASPSTKDPRWSVLPGQTSYDEFNTGSLAAGWTRVDPGTVGNLTWTSQGDVLSAQQAAATTGGSQGIPSLLQPLTALGGALNNGDGFVTFMQLPNFGQNYTMGGLLFADGNTAGAGKQVATLCYANLTYQGPIGTRGYTGFNSEVYSPGDDRTVPNPAGGYWIRFAMISANNWRVDYSADGISWQKGNTRSYTITPTYAGLFVSNYANATAFVATFECFRRVSGVT